MAADRFGTGATGAIPPTSSVSPVAAKPPVLPMQAAVLARPPTLNLSSATIVTGTLGPAMPNGEVPLSTSFGNVLLRPVPGAWPSDLPSGSTVSLMLGPGSRAGNIQQVAPPPTVQGSAERPAPLATARPPAGGAELALRGFLATTGVQAAGAALTPRPVVAPAGAAPAAAPPNPGQASNAPAVNTPLLAAAGAVQVPKPGPVTIAAPASAADPQRGLAATLAPQAVADVAKEAKAGMQDLQRQALLQGQAEGVKDGRARIIPSEGLSPSAAAPLPPSADSAAPRPDLMLAQALAHPGMVARMAAFMPRADRLGGVALLLYLFGARNGGVRAWLGDDQLRHLTRSEAGALAEVEEAMVPKPRMASDGSVWSTLMVPFNDGDKPSVMMLATMPGLVMPVEGDEAAPEQQTEGGEPATAFTLGLELSLLGPVQLRGFGVADRLVLDLSVSGLPDKSTRSLFEAAVDKALLRLDMRTSLRLHWGRGPFLPDLMPAAGLPLQDHMA